jgi:hypothetical protein
LTRTCVSIDHAEHNPFSSATTIITTAIGEQGSCVGNAHTQQTTTTAGCVPPCQQQHCDAPSLQLCQAQVQAATLEVDLGGCLEPQHVLLAHGHCSNMTKVAW